jgi:hypothetical protein
MPQQSSNINNYTNNPPTLLLNLGQASADSVYLEHLYSKIVDKNG